MNGDGQCQGRTKIMDRGCATAPNIPAPANSPEKFDSVQSGVDLYTQALKALSERSPFDSSEILATTVPTLPSGFASLLSKHADSRKKHKRHHSDTKSSRKGATEKSKSLNIWVLLEDYFKELTLQDFERLCRFSVSFSCISDSSCFRIPVLGNSIRNNKNLDNGHCGGSIQVVVAKQEETSCADDDHISSFEAVETQEINGEIERYDNIDSVSRDSSVAVVEKCSLPPQGSSQLCSSVEWVLGSRNRVLLTTTRPTKKRKLLGGTAGLERLVVSKPCEGSLSLCHVCSMGETGDQLNQLAVCKSCNAVVHQKCYGVQGEIDGSWLCSFCKHIVDLKAGRVSGSNKPCVICPKTGGASKLLKRAGGGNNEDVEFAHLFCSQWMPEVFIDDTRLMEPLLSIEAINDVRGKLLCNLCKVGLGFCARCSDGSCRTSFHPICAREAGNKLEIWGKFGCDDIELRVFCSKHSESACDFVKSKQSDAITHDILGTSYQPAVVSVNKIKKLKIGCKNRNKVTFLIGPVSADSSNMDKCESQEVGQKDVGLNLRSGVGGGKGPDMKVHETNSNEHVKTSHLDLSVVLKKLMDRGKVSLQQIASDINITADSLATKLVGNQLSPEVYSKILLWLRDHAYMDTLEKDLTTKVKSLIPVKAMLEADNSSNAVAMTDLDMLEAFPVKSVPPRWRTVGNIVILKEDERLSSWKDKLMGDGVSVGKRTYQDHVNDDSNNDSISNGTNKIVFETVKFDDRLEEPSPTSESPKVKSRNLCDVERNGSEEGTDSGKSSLVDLDLDIPCWSSVDTFSHCEGDIKHGAESFVHPYIQKKLDEVQSWLSQTVPPNIDGFVEHKFSSTEQPSYVGVCCKNINNTVSLDGNEKNIVIELHDMDNGKQMEIQDFCPENEVEGEIIYYQLKLLDNAVVQKRHADELVCKIVRSLPNEMDAVRKQRWDDVLVNRYVYELKETRKQGRKEKRFKEAQAVLATATAAAAASTRISSLRKDGVDEQELGSSRIRGGHPIVSASHEKETLSNLGLPKIMSGRYSGHTPKGRPRSCDICRRAESLLNTVLVCSSCKVAVHLNCYHSVKETTGPWYCELCEDSSLSKASSTAAANYLVKPCPVAECGLCGSSTTGAFRKSSNGEWIHAFCAEWVFDATFKRGQEHPVEGMATVLKDNDICSVCERRYGVCIKCNYGNCEATFHPLCARSAGYYLYARNIAGGKMQHKAYCCKHSLEKGLKVETQKHAAEDLKIIKHHRVKLEKLRLLCERIVKREKLKRDLVICNHDILASKRDSVGMMPLRRPFALSHEVSSESATTSLKGHTTDGRSCSEAMQKSDDVTVDSAFSAKTCIRVPIPVDNDQKTDDSSTSQKLPTPKLTDRVSFSGKQIPIRAGIACRNVLQRGEQRLKSRKHADTFKKELVMTSDQASMKNQRLPKGYIYVPMDSLAKAKQAGKQFTHNSVEKREQDG